MKKIIITLLVISLVLLTACQPTEPQETQKTEPIPVVKEPIIKEPEQKTIRPEPEVEAPPKKAAPTNINIDQVCDVLLPVERFAQICQLDAEAIDISIRQSEKNCWISFTDKNQKRLTAGLTVVDWESAEEADREFDRGLSMRRIDAETDVGSRNYKYQEIERENIVWTNGKFLSHAGASTQLCTKEQLFQIAKEIDGNLG